ncbi:MAG: class I SAM-dependent methyltransferase [Deltaproteobacteria bacterium]|nr:class I SAM-dependent methyltransferase [Deltaproteobacteria bacterium]
MTVFGEYAGFYDALYREKDYEAECDFLDKIFSAYSKAPVRTVLDLGCGTGGHACLMAKRGYDVAGRDLSQDMLDIALKKAKENNVHVDFGKADVRNFDVGRKFDAVIAMFAVTGYQTSNDDVEAMLKCVRQHLDRGGLFVFDVWHGHAVLSVRPEARSKEFIVAGEKVVRIAEPVLDVENHVVEVRYTFERDKKPAVKENHRMRFFFPQELRYFLSKAGFETMEIAPFMKLGEHVGIDDWNIVVMAKAG